MSSIELDLPPHPARFPLAVIGVIRPYLKGYRRVLDPMAGVGTLGAWANNEIEPEWAGQCGPRTTIADARALPFCDASFDACATSCCFGNRMSDHHNARDASKRHTYRHYIGRPLHPANGGRLQWGASYRELHEGIWAECWRVLKPGGRMIVNISDHIRRGERQGVSAWHLWALHRLGFVTVHLRKVRTPRQRHGANGHLRVDHEWVFVLERP